MTVPPTTRIHDYGAFPLGLPIPSPAGVLFRNVARKLTADGCLRLQGFRPALFRSVVTKNRSRLAGNAVAVPVGQFAVETVIATTDVDLMAISHSYLGPNGVYERGEVTEVADLDTTALATNLADFVDVDDQVPLSQKAAPGLVHLLSPSGKPCPSSLLIAFCRAAGMDEIPDSITRSESGQSGGTRRSRRADMAMEAMF